MKLFLKYMGMKKRDDKRKTKTTTAKVIYPDTDRIELENRQRVDSQVKNYLRDKYERINEMNKEEEKKKKEARERAEERKRADEAKQRQDIADAKERAADVNRAIARERKLQSELNADRRANQTIQRQILAGNTMTNKLIEDSKSTHSRTLPPPPPPGKPPRKAPKDGGVIVEDVSERMKAEDAAKQAKRETIIISMFSKPVKKTDTKKMSASKFIDTLERLEYKDIVRVKIGNTKRVDCTKTAQSWLRRHPEIYLGQNDKQAWSNVLPMLGSKLNALNRKKAEEAKKKPPADNEEPEEGEVIEKQGAAEEKKAVEESDDDDLVDESDDDPDQVGIGAADIIDECFKMLRELKIPEIKKILNKKHTNKYRKEYKHKGKMLKSNYVEALMFIMADDDAVRKVVCGKINQPKGKPFETRQIGKGDGDGRGLTTTQIEEIMKDEKQYIGTVASDEIKTLKPKGSKYGFIMNTDKASQPGQHWIAVYLDLKGDKTVEVYDPLGTYEPTKEFLEQIKALVDKAKLDHYLLLKVNKIKRQSDTSDTCGWFGVKFLTERFMGNRFKFSTGFTELKEDEIQKYKKQNGYGFDTYL